ncbi:LysR family transcriptional regulator [Paraferrimonas sedimenticola]|uniref:LysR family transcriptional regulator n=1 Tax=Paraferrimonas sedimenticola TaxID=375674 RepID=A0AA37RXD2_9GAMM|nr:LysR family transcriptional regulator [Paraferrimonas sedimenticola]GLP96412.1 LysR family transcriptional regulator [Paraferrimonas sedimenticola]
MLTINLLQLQAFVLAAEQGSFSAAGRKLKKTHSAISMTISNLELDLNQELFDRSTRNPKLTAAGEVLYKEAKLILSRCQHFETLAEEFHPEQESKYTIAIEPAYNVPQEHKLLEYIDQSFPGLELQIKQQSSAEIIKTVLNEEADIGFILVEQGIFSNLNTLTLPAADLIYVAAPEHPLSELDKVTLHDLEKHRQAVLERPSHQQDVAVSPFVWRCDTVRSAAEITQYGFTWTMAVKDLLQSYLDSGLLVELPVHHTLKRSIPAALIWRAGQSDGMVHQGVIDYMRLQHSG